MSDTLTPWRARLADWPDEWRERWGLRANELEVVGLTWVEAERQAMNETMAAKRQHESTPMAVALVGERTTRTLFKESA